MIENSADLLYKTYISLKDSIQAFKYFFIESKAKDSIAVMQNQQEIAKIEFQYKINKEIQQKEILQTRKNILMILIFTLLIVIILVIILLYSRQKIKVDKLSLEKQKVQLALDYKNKEFTANLLSMGKNKEILDVVAEKLQNINRRIEDRMIKKNVQELVHEMETYSDDKLWKELSLRFNEVNNDFFSKLTEKFPNLTENELRLCAFLQLNMSSKDISLITGQRIATLENARYRLRKKLGISNTEVNLTTFLSQL
jgi:hypothetical protein